MHWLFQHEKKKVSIKNLLMHNENKLTSCSIAYSHTVAFFRSCILLSTPIWGIFS
jgi:hypothetical protein